jgi:hypothetical protein
LTLEIEGTTSANQVIYNIPAQSGLSVLLPGQPLTGQGSAGSTLKGFASTSNSVNIIGYVNRETV